jgi:hypothetical protein
MNIPPGLIDKDNKLIFSTSSTKGNSKKYILHFKKNMYRHCQAGNKWFDKHHESLIIKGFTQSSINPCLFICSSCSIIVYVGDCLLFAKTDTTLVSVISSLQSESNPMCKGDVGAFVGVDTH